MDIMSPEISVLPETAKIQPFLQIDYLLDQDYQPLNTPINCLEAARQITNYFFEDPKVPEGTIVYSCSSNSVHDPHHWIEIMYEDGSKYVWDRSNQKIIGAHILPKELAIKRWANFTRPDESIQIFPETVDQPL